MNRSEVVRLRVTPQEKAAIEKLATDEGVDSISDLIRHLLGLAHRRNQMAGQTRLSDLASRVEEVRGNTTPLTRP